MPQSLLALFKDIRPSRTVLAGGARLFAAGEPAGAIHVVERGRVRLERLGVPLQVAEAGAVFGEWALFTETCPCDAVADQDSTVLAFAKTPVLLLLRAHPDLNLAFSAYLARQLHRTRGRLELMRQKGARERVLGYLIRAGAADASVTLERTLTDIAHDIGLTREAVYRTLAKLEREGVLERAGTRTFRVR